MGMLTNSLARSTVQQLQSNACQALTRLTQKRSSQSGWHSCKGRGRPSTFQSDTEPFWTASRLRSLVHLASTEKERGKLCGTTEERRFALSASKVYRQGEALCERPSQSRSLFTSQGVRGLKASAMASSATEKAFASGVEQLQPWKGKVKLAVCQLSVVANKQQNIDHAREVIEKAADDGAKLIVLPEMWNCPYSNDSFPTYAEDIDGGDSPSSDMLSAAAKSKEVTIVGGSIPEKSDGKLYNTCCIYGANGKLLGKHRKMHLFDIDIPGKITFKESDTLSPGNAFTVVNTDVGCIGVGICYDIRFPELAMLSAARGAQILCYPGAFNMTTGPLHWELLAKARAVDNQLFVVTCSPARNEGAGYIAWGHSTVVGPFGKIEGALEEKEGVMLLEVDLSEIDTRRTNMPLEQQRRHDVYKLIDVK